MIEKIAVIQGEEKTKQPARHWNSRGYKGGEGEVLEKKKKSTVMDQNADKRIGSPETKSGFKHAAYASCGRLCSLQGRRPKRATREAPDSSWTE